MIFQILFLTFVVGFYGYRIMVRLGNILIELKKLNQK